MADDGRRPMRVEDLYLLGWPLEPAISPDGASVAYAAARLDEAGDRLDTRIHVVDVATGATTIVRSVGPTRRPRWAPDGGRLAARVWNGDRWQLADIYERVAHIRVALDGDVDAFDWSPDGGRLVCELRSAAPAARSLWEIDLVAGRCRRLASPEAGEPRAAVWAPDADRLAFVSDAGTGGDAVWTLDAGRSQSPVLVAAGWARVESLCWSPDGSSLALIAGPDDAHPWANRELWLVATSSGDRRRLGAGLDRSVGQVVRGDDERGLGQPSLAWSPDGRAVLAAVADGGTSEILAFDVDGPGQAPLHGHQPGAVLEFDVARTGAIAYSWSDPWTPGEVTVRLPDGSLRPCSDLAAPLRGEVDLADTERVTVASTGGGSLDGWLTTPRRATADRSPLVLQIHGGPHYPVGERFPFDAQRLAAAGIAVLRANPRGSQGYGERFAAAVAGDWGGGDVDDLLALVDHVATHFPVDEHRMAVVGESYGAFVALRIIARGERFVAAVAENCVADLEAALARAPRFWRAELGAVADDGTELRARSPVALADRMTTPLLLVHAECDEVSPISQSEAMAAALNRAGQRVELVRLPGEGHFINVTGRPSSRLGKLRTVDAFLHRHLGGAVRTVGDAQNPEPSKRATVAAGHGSAALAGSGRRRPR